MTVLTLTPSVPERPSLAALGLGLDDPDSLALEEHLADDRDTSPADAAVLDDLWLHDAPLLPERGGSGTLRDRLARDDGASTAEYAITVLAACGFAALLVVILKSDQVRTALTSIITSALALGS